MVNHIIAAGHPETARAGSLILEAGGNAFDAAIAALLAAFVCESATISAGGGGFLLAHSTERQKNILYDFFVQTPQQQHPQQPFDFRAVTADFGGNTMNFHVGLAAIGIPGNIAGAFHIQQQLGKMSFKQLAEPAIALAKTGVPLHDFQLTLMRLLQPIIMDCAEARAIFTNNNDNSLKKVGDIIYIQHLADSLDYISREGKRAFYEGEIAQQLVKDSQERGGHITHNDLKNYSVIERQPLSCTYRNHTLLTNPPPSSGGTLIAFALQLLQTIDLKAHNWGSVAHLSALWQTQYLTNQARRKSFDANIYNPNVIKEFLVAPHIAQYAQTLRKIVGSTTQISVLDKWGNAASLTTSSGEGNSYYIPKTGIMTNNMLGEEDLNPNGFHQWTPNQRLSSMMSPTMICDKMGQVQVVLGSSGANRIRSAVLQSIVNLLDFGLPLEAAINHARLHVEGQQVNFELGFDPDICAQVPLPNDMERIIWQNQSMYFGGVNAVSNPAKGGYLGVADARRSGVVLA